MSVFARKQTEPQGTPTLTFSKSNLPTQIFINNKFVDATGSKKLSVFNPSTGDLVSDKVPLSSAQDVDDAVAAAKAAFPSWKKVLPVERRKIMLKFADLLESNKLALAELTRLTLGAPFGAFGDFEIGMASEAFRYNAGFIDKFAGLAFPQATGFLTITRNEPLGVCAGIVPWNSPVASAALKAAPALATGNCIIIKPSEKTPFATLALGQLIIEAGFPPGVFQVVAGDGSTGAVVASHMKISKVSFTGSVSTGKIIQKLAADSNLKRVTLELGGKSPAVIFDDANLENAVAWTVNGITGNTGQVCFASSKVYVQAGIYDRFMEAYKAGIAEKIRAVGDPENEGTMLGPLIDASQFDRVSSFIKRGQEAGATLAVGGKRVGTKGCFIEPTVFTNVAKTAEIYREEIFGPVSIVNKFTTEEEVLEWCNDSEFGLMAGVFTQDINRGLRMASEIESGMVGINCVSLTQMNAPFGGSKQSGSGREMGEAALKAFTELKTVMVNLTY